MGVLRWTGEQFRAATLAEFVLALDGYLESKGIQKTTPITRNELLDLVDIFGK